MLRAIKIRLYPNKTQEQEFNKILGCYRFVYNHMLARKQEAYKTDKTNLGLTELCKYFHGNTVERWEICLVKGTEHKGYEAIYQTNVNGLRKVL